MGSFIVRLRQETGVAALALEFQILTATRPGEVMGAKWAEINLGEELWIIPGDRMKAGREHRVPLSPRAIEILRQLSCFDQGSYVFPGRRFGKPLANNTLLALLKKRMKIQITSHGFRSSFRDWAAERTHYPGEVVEMALAHAIKNATESAYRRGDLLLQRRALMSDWAAFCASVPSSAKLFELDHRIAQ
jgi:integrase